MGIYLLIFYAAYIGVIFGFLLGGCWWWIEFQIRYRMLARLAESLKRMADMLEYTLERLWGLAEEAERGLTECRQRET